MLDYDAPIHSSTPHDERCWVVCVYVVCMCVYVCVCVCVLFVCVHTCVLCVLTSAVYVKCVLLPF